MTGQNGFISLLLIPLIIFFSCGKTFSFITPVENVGISREEPGGINVEQSIEVAPSRESRDVIQFDIFEDITRARTLLEKRHCGFKIVKLKKGKRNELDAFTILLAIENVATRNIRVVRIHPELGGTSEGIIVEPGKSNGVNTQFIIKSPAHHIVLAIKRPVRHGKTFKEVVYTPYSEGINIPGIRETGLLYLKNVLREARNDLTRRGTIPLSDRFMTENVSLTLAIIEHIDPLKFESGKYTTEQLIHETLVILGANKQAAYRFSASRAGARGLFQFTPDTYGKIVRLYPWAGLNRNFIRGMEDHKNAAKASLLLFNADLRTINNGKTEQFTDSARITGRLIAAAYNCGSGKTRIAMDRHGSSWHANVPAETQIYLKKFDAVWDWLHHHTQSN